jgi:iron complex outermembrane receptor protein
MRFAGASSAVLASLIAAPIIFAAGSAAAQAAPPPAPAQNAAPSDQGGVQEVVVTAQFHAQNLQKTPLAITAVTGKMLEARGQNTVDQIANEAPNVTLKPGPEPFGPSMQTYIRGIGQSDFDPALSPGVGMYVNDVYYGTITGTNFKLLDLDRVEVLRGPQGTLSGQNSIGGSIKLYTKQPDGNDGGFFSVGYGSYNQVELKGAADFTVIPDQLFVRVSGYSDQQGGYVKTYDYGCTHPGSNVPSQVTGPNCQSGTEGGTNADAGRIEIRWTPTPKLDVHIALDDTQDDSEASAQTLLYVGTNNPTGTPPNPGIAGLPPGKAWAGPVGTGVPLGTANGSAFITTSQFEPSLDTFSHSPYVSYANFCDADPADGTAAYCVPRINHFEGWGFAGTIDYKLTDDISFKSITGYRKQDASWTDDEDASPVSDNMIANQTQQWQFSEEARLSGTLADNTINWTVGGFYYEDVQRYTARVDLDVFDFLENDRVPSNTEAGFANVEWKATDKLTIDGGLRYTQQQKTFVFGRLGVPGTQVSSPATPANPAFPFIYIPCNGPGAVPLALPLCGLNGSSSTFKGDKVDYRVAVEYQLTPDFMAYFQTATGFKGGGIDPRPFTLGQEADHFGPENDTNYEVGFKSDWFDHRVRLNAAAFYDQYDAIQLTVLTCPQFGPAPSCAAPINAGNATISGVELESEVHPTDALEIDSSLSYLDFQFTSLGPNALASGITKSMKEPFAPPWKFDIGAQYAFGMGSSWGTLTPRLDLTYQASFWAQIPNDPYNNVAGYTLLNGSLIWRDANNKWQVGVQVNNITNKLYYLGVFDNRQTEDGVVGEPAPPREWEVTLKRTF